MTNLAKKYSSELIELESTLLTQLDEKIFFIELTNLLKQLVSSTNIQTHLVSENSDVKIIVDKGEAVKNSEQSKGTGIVGHVVRTKRPYFCRNINKDPLFQNNQNINVSSEMCIPVSVEGVIIATITFQNREEGAFKQENILSIKEVISKLSRPISNIKMFMQAKQLNELLMQQLEKKDNELLQNKNGLSIFERPTIEEKEIIGITEDVFKLKKFADKLAAVPSNCLLQGEAGVGKELFSRRIHCRSERGKKAYVVLDISSFSTDEEMELEIFGEEIIGASVKKSALEIASGGTLVLKNIEFLSTKLQAKLNHFIEEKKTTRVYGEVPFSADVRIVATSSVDLSLEVEKGNFREDLYYSIGKIILLVPSLREHIEDVEILANYFLNYGLMANEQKILSPGAIKLVREYNWPGNIRELKSVIERAYILSDTKVVERTHLIDKIDDENSTIELQDNSIIEDDFEEMTLEVLEQKHIVRTLDYLGGNKTKTAKVLGITVKTLYNKLHNYGMIEQKEA